DLSQPRDDARGARHQERTAVGLGLGLRSAAGIGDRGAGAGTRAGGQVMKRFAVAAALVAFAIGLAASGEGPQGIQYKQGVYQGKPYSQPYQGAPYNGDRAAWERAVAQRAQAQNEYKRTN